MEMQSQEQVSKTSQKACATSGASLTCWGSWAGQWQDGNRQERRVSRVLG